VGVALTGSPALRQIRDESSHDANYVALHSALFFRRLITGESVRPIR